MRVLDQLTEALRKQGDGGVCTHLACLRHSKGKRGRALCLHECDHGHQFHHGVGAPKGFHLREGATSLSSAPLEVILPLLIILKEP